MGLSAFTCTMHCWDSGGGHPSASRHVLVEDLASNCRKKNPLCPNPFTLSCPTGASGAAVESTSNAYSGSALLCLRRPLCYLSQSTGMERKAKIWLSIAGDWHFTPMSQQETRAMKVGLCNRVGFLSNMAESLSYDNENALILICYKYYLPRWSLGKILYTYFSLQEMFLHRQ